jgi:hypothetical protein
MARPQTEDIGKRQPRLSAFSRMAEPIMDYASPRCCDSASRMLAINSPGRPRLGHAETTGCAGQRFTMNPGANGRRPKHNSAMSIKSSDFSLSNVPD